MPLIKSASKTALGRNIKTLQKEGKSRKVALAISLDIQERAKRKKK